MQTIVVVKLRNDAIAFNLKFGMLTNQTNEKKKRERESEVLLSKRKIHWRTDKKCIQTHTHTLTTENLAIQSKSEWITKSSVGKNNITARQNSTANGKCPL